MLRTKNQLETKIQKSRALICQKAELARENEDCEAICEAFDELLNYCDAMEDKLEIVERPAYIPSNN